jgi:hypothetical protein
MKSAIIEAVLCGTWENKYWIGGLQYEDGANQTLVSKVSICDGTGLSGILSVRFSVSGSQYHTQVYYSL